MVLLWFLLSHTHTHTHNQHVIQVNTCACLRDLPMKSLKSNFFYFPLFLGDMTKGMGQNCEIYEGLNFD